MCVCVCAYARARVCQIPDHLQSTRSMLLVKNMTMHC